MTTDRAYFDSSVLVKRYIHEEASVEGKGSARRHRVVSSANAPVEITSALVRRPTEARISDRDFGAILSQMRADSNRWELVEVNQPVLDRAAEVIEETGVRTPDALHIASALVFEALSGIMLGFITVDVRQTEGARRMALKVTKLDMA
jgi:predicted nucleic acid-binding protein